MFVLQTYIPYSKFEFFAFDLYTIGYSLYNTMPSFLLAAGIILFLGIFAVFYLNTGLNSWVFITTIISNTWWWKLVNMWVLETYAFKWFVGSIPTQVKSIKNNFFGIFFSLSFFDNALWFLFVLLYIVLILLVVAFYTLAERKLLAAVQRRKGPNVNGFWGLLQPIYDGVKLIFKENLYPFKIEKILFILAPVVTFVISFTLWSLMPLYFINFSSNLYLNLLLFFAFSSIGVYGIIFGGWASNSKYAFLGALRSSAQMISYEIVLGTIFLCISFSVGSLNFLDIIYAQTIIWFIFPFFLLFLLFLITILAETNRIPFDLPEAESELVAGYNIEYSAIAFALFFLAEYSTMILFSVLGALLFFGGNLPFLNFFGLFLYILKILVFTIFFVLIRGTLPRLRYDQLLFNNWLYFIPFSFLFFLFLVFMFYFYNPPIFFIICSIFCFIFILPQSTRLNSIKIIKEKGIVAFLPFLEIANSFPNITWPFYVDEQFNEEMHMLFQAVLAKYFFIEVVDNNYLFFQFYAVMAVVYFILFSFCFLNYVILIYDVTDENIILLLNHHVYYKFRMLKEQFIWDEPHYMAAEREYVAKATPNLENIFPLYVDWRNLLLNLPLRIKQKLFTSRSFRSFFGNTLLLIMFYLPLLYLITNFMVDTIVPINILWEEAMQRNPDWGHKLVTRVLNLQPTDPWYAQYMKSATFVLCRYYWDFLIHFRNYLDEEDEWLTFMEFQHFEYDHILEFSGSGSISDMAGYLKLRANLEAICEAYDNNPLAWYYNRQHTEPFMLGNIKNNVGAKALALKFNNQPSPRWALQPRRLRRISDTNALNQHYGVCDDAVYDMALQNYIPFFKNASGPTFFSYNRSGMNNVVTTRMSGGRLRTMQRRMSNRWLGESRNFNIPTQEMHEIFVDYYGAETMKSRGKYKSMVNRFGDFKRRYKRKIHRGDHRLQRRRKRKIRRALPYPALFIEKKVPTYKKHTNLSMPDTHPKWPTLLTRQKYNNQNRLYASARYAKIPYESPEMHAIDGSRELRHDLFDTSIYQKRGRRLRLRPFKQRGIEQVFREFEERGHWVAYADLFDQRLDTEQEKEWWQFKYNNDAWKLTIIQNLLFGTLYTPRSKYLNKECKYNFNERWVEMPDYDRRSTIFTKKQAVHSLIVKPGYHKDFEWYFFLLKEYSLKYEELGINKHRAKEQNFLFAFLIWYFVQSIYELLDEDIFEEFGYSEYFRIVCWPEFWHRLQLIFFGILRDDLETIDGTTNNRQSPFSKHKTIIYTTQAWLKKADLPFFKKMFNNSTYFLFSSIKNTTTRLHKKLLKQKLYLKWKNYFKKFEE